MNEKKQIKNEEKILQKLYEINNKVENILVLCIFIIMAIFVLFLKKILFGL